jgi:uncharacterized protein (TIGR02246 family)
MQSDEQTIRALISDWQSAATEGDVQRLQELMSEDVVFLMPGQPPMRGRKAFMEAFQEGMKHYRIESTSEIKELHVAADLAYCWTHLSVTATPHRAGLPMRRSGHVLSILQKQPGRGWVIVRDANMLTPEPATTAL